MACQLDVSESKTPTCFIEYSTKIKNHSSNKEMPKGGFMAMWYMFTWMLKNALAVLSVKCVSSDS